MAVERPGGGVREERMGHAQADKCTKAISGLAPVIDLNDLEVKTDGRQEAHRFTTLECVASGKCQGPRFASLKLGNQIRRTLMTLSCVNF